MGATDPDEIRCAFCGVPLDEPYLSVPSDDDLTDWWVCPDCHDAWALTRLDTAEEAAQITTTTRPEGA
jgi:hypothetical protein